MTYQETPLIGENVEQEAHSAPALRRSLAEIVAEYEAKAESLTGEIAAFEAATNAVKSAASIGGAFGGTIFDREPWLHERKAAQALLKSAWRHVYDGLQIGKIASAKDRKTLEVRLENPPPFTIPALRETFGDYLIDPRFHMLKGLAECFCDLDPAYRSHSKVKIGVAGLPKRIIVGSVAGWRSWGRERVEDSLNALRLYRGRPRHEFREFEAMMDEAERHGESDFDGGRIKRFKNGNAHLIFDAEGLRDINRALAEFYGEVLPDAPSETEAKKPSTALARDLQFYPTPARVIETVLREVRLRDGMAVLEPSCGDGRIMDALAAWDGGTLDVTGIEWDAGRVAEARAKGHGVYQGNFLEVPPEPRFDAVVMNPPFYGRHYRKHLDHAMQFLAPGGVLVCILPASAHYDHGDLPGSWHDLPVGSFASSGTRIPTGYCVHRRRG